MFGKSALPLREQVCSGSQIILLQTYVHQIKFLCDACRPCALFWLESSRQLSSSALLGRDGATWPGCLQKPEGIVWFHADSCSWCLRKEDVLPCCLDRKLPNGREKQENELHLKKCLMHAQTPLHGTTGLQKQRFQVFFDLWRSSLRLQGSSFPVSLVLQWGGTYRQVEWQNKEPIPVSQTDHCLAWMCCFH